MKKVIGSPEDMLALGQTMGQALRGGETIELLGDVGAGKTTLTKGLALGLGVEEDVQSPSFTLSRQYPARDGLELHHYDFYRLPEPGVVAHELAESVNDQQVVTVIEWAATVDSVLPKQRLIIELNYLPDEREREVEFSLPSQYQYLSGVTN